MTKTKFNLSKALCNFRSLWAILFRSFSFIAQKNFYLIWLSNLLTMNVPGEGYSRNT